MAAATKIGEIERVREPRLFAYLFLCHGIVKAFLQLRQPFLHPSQTSFCVLQLGHDNVKTRLSFREGSSLRAAAFQGKRSTGGEKNEFRKRSIKMRLLFQDLARSREQVSCSDASA